MVFDTSEEAQKKVDSNLDGTVDNADKLQNKVPSELQSEIGKNVSLNEYRSFTNRIIGEIAENQFEVGLTQLGYPDGIFDVFVNQNKVSNASGISVNTGTNGNIELSTGILIDNLESGSSKLNFESNSDVSINSNSVMNGSNCIEISGNTFLQDKELDNPFTSETESFEVSVLQQTLSSDSVSYRPKNSNQERIYQIKFSNGDLIEAHTLTDLVKDVSPGEIYRIEIIPDFQNNEGEIKVNGVSKATIPFENNSNKISYIEFAAGDNASVFIDNYVYDGDGSTTSGSLTSTTQDKGYQATRGTLTADYSLNGQNIDSFQLFDGSDKLLAEWNESEIGETKSVFTSRTDYYIKINLSGNGSDSPKINKYEVGLDDGQ